jgi:hypothetical protein
LPDGQWPFMHRGDRKATRAVTFGRLNLDVQATLQHQHTKKANKSIVQSNRLPFPWVVETPYIPHNRGRGVILTRILLQFTINLLPPFCYPTRPKAELATRQLLLRFHYCLFHLLLAYLINEFPTSFPRLLKQFGRVG